MRDGTFLDATVGSGTGLDDNGMGHAVADFDNDGLLDWYVTSIHNDNPQPDDYTGNTLYRSLGRHEFVEISVPAGVNDGGWGWGALAVDLDQDGWLDIVEVNGRDGGGQWADEAGKLYHNQCDRTFDEIALVAGFDHVGEGRSIAWLDGDRDGDQDLVLLVNDVGLEYYRNDTLDAGNWLQLRLEPHPASTNPPNGIGARVTVWAGGRRIVRYLDGSPSYLATSELTVHFGLGDARIVDRLSVTWPNGTRTWLHDLPVNRRIAVADSAVETRRAAPVD